MAYLIDRLQKSLAKEGLAARSDASRAWLNAKVKTLKPTAESLMKDRDSMRSKTMMGRMYFYFYDPKGKDTLPYYDRFPLVIPIEQYPDGFLGLNLHYLHPKIRLILLDKLSTTITDDDYTDKSRLQLRYDTLQGLSTAYEAAPCLKRYLFTHIESRFLEIPASEWDIAALLPVESFAKKGSSYVWRKSKEQF